MILVNRTYTETTPDSVENGEFSDRGFIAENVSYTFKELVQLLKDHSEASNWPANGKTSEWYSTGYYTSDYATGTDRNESVHYSQENQPKNAKYWRKASIAAGIVKG